MKTIYTFILLALTVGMVKAQIPNNSFETWSNGAPAGWDVVNSPDTLVVLSTDAWDGTYAVRFNVSEVAGITFGGLLFSGDTADAFFPVNSVPAALYGWYISHPVDSGDALTINSSVESGGYGVSELAATIADTTAVYKQFIINYYPATDMGHDSVFLEFGLQNQTEYSLSTATYFIIDDLTFGAATTGIAEVNKEAALEQCVPNPASSTANIIYSITGHSTVNLHFYDMLGHQVKTLLDNTEQTPGRYKIPTDVSALPNGVYFYSLNVNGQIYTQKLLVEK